jgi:hypothetical protein
MSIDMRIEQNGVMVVALMVFLVAVVPMCSGSSPYSEQLPPLGEQILEAARIADDAARKEVLLGLLNQSLIDSDYHTRSLTLDLLGRMSAWFDFSPYEQLAYELRQEKNDRTLYSILDRQNFERMPNQEREAILFKAITTDKASLPRGTRIDRFVAIGVVAQRGIVELQEVCEKHYPLLSTTSKEWLPLERFRLELELTAGGGTRDRALKVAAKRLQEMDECQFRKRLKDDEDFFREMVRYFAAVACDINPIDRSQRASCEGFYRLFKREWSRGEDEPASIDSSESDWIRSLAGFSIRDEMFLYRANRERGEQLKKALQQGYGIEEARIKINPAPCSEQ